LRASRPARRSKLGAPTDGGKQPCYFFLSRTVSDCAREKALPPREDWNVNVAVTGTPVLCLKAFLSAFNADTLGLTVKLTTPTAASLLPLPKAILDGRHLPLRRTNPFPHFAVADANTPNRPFRNVSSQRKVPGSLTDPLNVIAPVLRFNVAVRLPKRLLGGVGDVLTFVTDAAMP